MFAWSGVGDDRMARAAEFCDELLDSRYRQNGVRFIIKNDKG